MKRLSVEKIIQKIENEETFEAVSKDYSFTIKIDEYVHYACGAVHDGHQFRKELWGNCLHTEYERWFGEYASGRAETVRENLKAVVGAIRSGNVTAHCDPSGYEACEGGTFAWVNPHEPYLMHLCPPFFSLPPLAALQPGARRSDNGTREGTIVHELSHFTRVADTDDHCYSRSDCADMATYDTRRAIDNADSYQYFTEDATYYARQLVPGKP